MARKLNDTQLTILSNAAARDNQRVLPLPRLKAPPVAVQKTLKAMLADGLIEAIPATRDDEVWAHSETDRNTTLIVTDVGLAAIGIEGAPTDAQKSARKPAKRATRAMKARKGGKVAKTVPRTRAAGTSDKRESKQDTVIALLQRPHGASIEEMMEATGWQAHSVRGFMSGALKRRLGLELASEKDKKSGQRRYRITD